ncbi:hypothetical protein ABEB36_001128 [Hypothenemus hampei]|uniref:Protein Jumonji n=1 Tax=Hypothenemus hampei TaxID=57062 RepID=A0ABD1FDM7_HYPHA
MFKQFSKKNSTMKRKRKEVCSSPILEENPKRTKVQAQRKFAQNSGVHSPIITPIRDIESVGDVSQTDTLLEPVELLPIKRPNTEDFLTFLCFRGTPILPSNLQFFNTASIVTDGQVHEIKGDCPKNGPIDITKCAGTSSSEKPFIAYGVRKRADPIVISKQMERKRRHALALQALRRKYQEQKMAKIRALTISKLSEKTTNKTLVKTNTVQKTETVTKKSNTLQKTKVIATKHVKVTTTQTLKTNLKPRMCLRSFRGKFVQKELPFRPRKPQSEEETSPTSLKSIKSTKNNVDKNEENAKLSVKRPQIKRRIILPSTIVTTIVKPKLRSTTMKKTVISRRKAQQRLRSRNVRPENKELLKKVEVKGKGNEEEEMSRRLTRRDSEQVKASEEVVKCLEVKKEVKIEETGGKRIKKDVNVKKVLTRRSEAQKVNESQTDSIKKKSLRNSKLEVKKAESSNKLSGIQKKSSNQENKKTGRESPKKIIETKSPTKKSDQEFSKKIQDLINTALKQVEQDTPQEKNVEIEVKIKVEQDVKPKKEPLEVELENSKRKTRRSESETVAVASVSRPTRKTKEAAAIYMEILSHKLVNDSTIDDDNVSIESYPELPNVKRTEQREIELKAQQAKTGPSSNVGVLRKRKSNPLVINSEDEEDDEDNDDDDDDEVSGKKDEECKRQTRRSAQILKESESDFSDESFRADIKVPKKRKNTRSRTCKTASTSSVLEKNVDIILEAARVLEEDVDSNESKKKPKKVVVKANSSFSDSDEEPLSKLTIKSTEDSTKKTRLSNRKTVTDKEATIMEPKPKRECTKRPSNYLPMLSSSDDEDDYFYGFNTSKNDVSKTLLAPSLDLLSKDLGRKGKVNMSNEQIEQWLKDSALAAKDNDVVPKFVEKKEPSSSKSNTVPKQEKIEPKSPANDRKWIFKKDKKDSMPNKNAFSPENECSVYAFGEEAEDVVSTPFRRPCRRPSSTATSRSEDESSKMTDDVNVKYQQAQQPQQFRKPQPSDSEDSRCFMTPKVMPQGKKTMTKATSSDVPRQPDSFDDSKYKVPSSPSASSSSSSKLYKKAGQKMKTKMSCESTLATPIRVTDFPKSTDAATLVEAPVFHPTEQEFQNPLDYIESIRTKAEQFGICKIVPPTGFKPECKVSDDMRFTAYNQYVHKMLHRWGPNFKEFLALRKYLATQSISLKSPPSIGGMEVDLPRLYHTVQSLGGLKEVIEKKKWSKVSDLMKIPKSAQDRVTKLDDIYCKYLLPYDTLSPAEREKLFDEIESYWTRKTQAEPTEEEEEDSDQELFVSDDDIEECTVKGKNMALNAFYRIARNTMSMFFKGPPEPAALEVEREFWRYVTEKQNHICVHSASIDCGTWGYGFAVSKNSPCAKHPWNLKVLSNNNGTVLRSLGPVMGVTIPTLHVGMVFSACCWYRDPHGLPWVEYLHTGASKIWYGIPKSSYEVFRTAMQKLVPNYCRDKELWLPSDTAMVPPDMLLDENVSLCKTIQEPGQFMVVFPKVYTSSICTGYVVSESVYFAPLHWLKTARGLFDELKNSYEPSMFSLDKLFVSIVNDNRTNHEVLTVIMPFVQELCTTEKENRIKLRKFGTLKEERMCEEPQSSKKKKIQSVDNDFECEICRTNLYVSMILDTQEDLVYCLEHAIALVEKEGKILDRLNLRYNLDETELENIPQKIQDLLDGKVQQNQPGKYAGLPTMLK